MLCVTVLLSWVRPVYGFLERLACREYKLGGESYRVCSAAVSWADGQCNQDDQGSGLSSDSVETEIVNSESGKPGWQIVAVENASVRNLCIQGVELTFVRRVLHRRGHSPKKKSCLQMIVQDTVVKARTCN